MWLSLCLSLATAPDLAPARGPGEDRPPHVVLLIWPDAERSRIGFEADLEPGAKSPTPSLDRLASTGFLFPEGSAAVEHARPAFGVLLTGDYPHRTGIVSQSGGARFASAERALPERLKAAGWATFAAGRFREGQPVRLGFEGAAEDILETEAGAIGRFLAGERGDRPFFLWWAPKLARTERDPASALDASLERLVADLERAGILDDTLFAFVTDPEIEGQGLPTDVASERQATTPIFFRLPGRVRAAASDLAATTYDLHATLLDYAGLDDAGVGPGPAPGVSLRPLLQGEAPALERKLAARPIPGEFFERAASRASKGGKSPEKDVVVLSWRKERWKYALYLSEVGVEIDRRAETASLGYAAGDQTLFDLESDPGEASDLSGRPDQAERLDAMRAELLAWWSASGGGDLRLPYLTPPLGPPPAKPLPNIVLVLSDDQDYEHLGFLGHPLGHQPTLDALARDGLVFPVAHVPMSRCRPSQAALLSGRWPHETRITDNEAAHPLTRRDSLPNLLKAAGYATFQGGKMWEGDSQSMGFLEPTTSDLHFLRFVRQGQDQLDDFIDRYHAERPLFVWWAPTLPHVPHDPPERLKERFRATPVTVPEGIEGDPDAFRAAERGSYAMEAWFDEGLAALVAKLEATHELDDTLFVFLIDNGWANGAPSKGTVFEKGLRTPVVFSWKKGLAGGRVDDRLVSSLDVYSTILDVAGVAVPPEARGVSLKPVLEGQDAARRTALYGVQYLYRARTGPPRPEKDAVALYARTERWKYVLYLKDVDDPAVYDYQTNFAAFPARRRGQRNLYDLAADPYERHDLSGDPQQVALMAELEGAILSWWDESGGAALDLPGEKGDTPRPPRRR